MEREFQEMLREMAPHVSKEELERMRLNFQQTLVSTEEALRGAASMRPLADSLRRAGERSTAAEAERLRAMLERLDAAGRAAAACLSSDYPPDLGPCRENNRLVRVNPRYFDPALGKAAVQLIVVSSPLHVREDPRHGELRRRIFDSLDRTGLAEVVVK